MNGITDFEKLGMKVGLEIHQQLDTKHKLFCNCLTTMRERETVGTITRKLHPVVSELGEIDVAAQFEYLKDRTFQYQIFRNETCLVEADEEPPHEVNKEALEIAMQIALLFNCQAPAEIQIMRKTVIDGSNTSGFQRTAIVGLNGYLEYKGRKVPITQVALEEDSASIVREDSGGVVYKLNRLGVPLVEVDTGLLIGFTPSEVQEIAYLIGMTCRSTRKTKNEIGNIRQDVNVSIEKGARVEIKGVQELGLIAKVIENEVKRQMVEKAKEETRTALLDGTTRFMRPLPGSKRMYPETDTFPVIVSNDYVEMLKDNLPESLVKKLGEFKSRLKLSDQLASEVVRSDYLDLFEKIVKTKKLEPSMVASTFTQTLKDLNRKNVPVSEVTEKHFMDVFDLLEKKKIAKEAVPEILTHLSKKPEGSVETAIKELNLTPLSMPELEKIIKEVINQPDITLDRAVGAVMSKVRGRIDAQTAINTVKRLLQT